MLGDVPANACSIFPSISPTSPKSENTALWSAAAKSVQCRHHHPAQQLSLWESKGLGVCSSTAWALCFASSGVTMSCCAWWKGLDVGKDTGEGSSVLGRDNSYHNHCTLLPCSLLLLHYCMENQSFGLGPKLSSFPSHFSGGWLEKSNKPKGQKVRIFS